MEFKLTKPRETSHSQPPIPTEGSRVLVLTSLELYNSILNKNTTNFKFEISTDTFYEISFTELKDEPEEIRDISNITSEHLQDDIKGPRIFSTYKKLETEKR